MGGIGGGGSKCEKAYIVGQKGFLFFNFSSSLIGLHRSYTLLKIHTQYVRNGFLPASHFSPSRKDFATFSGNI